MDWEDSQAEQMPSPAAGLEVLLAGLDGDEHVDVQECLESLLDRLDVADTVEELLEGQEREEVERTDHVIILESSDPLPAAKVTVDISAPSTSKISEEVITLEDDEGTSEVCVVGVKRTAETAAQPVATCQPPPVKKRKVEKPGKKLLTQRRTELLSDFGKDMKITRDTGEEAMYQNGLNLGFTMLFPTQSSGYKTTYYDEKSSIFHWTIELIFTRVTNMEALHKTQILVGLPGTRIIRDIIVDCVNNLRCVENNKLNPIDYWLWKIIKENPMNIQAKASVYMTIPGVPERFYPMNTTQTLYENLKQRYISSCPKLIIVFRSERAPYENKALSYAPIVFSEELKSLDSSFKLLMGDSVKCPIWNTPIIPTVAQPVLTVAQPIIMDSTIPPVPVYQPFTVPPPVMQSYSVPPPPIAVAPIMPQLSAPAPSLIVIQPATAPNPVRITNPSTLKPIIQPVTVSNPTPKVGSKVPTPAVPLSNKAIEQRNQIWEALQPLVRMEKAVLETIETKELQMVKTSLCDKFPVKERTKIMHEFINRVSEVLKSRNANKTLKTKEKPPITLNQAIKKAEKKAAFYARKDAERFEQMARDDARIAAEKLAAEALAAEKVAEISPEACKKGDKEKQQNEADEDTGDCVAEGVGQNKEPAADGAQESIPNIIAPLGADDIALIAQLKEKEKTYPSTLEDVEPSDTHRVVTPGEVPWRIMPMTKKQKRLERQRLFELEEERLIKQAEQERLDREMKIKLGIVEPPEKKEKVKTLPHPLMGRVTMLDIKLPNQFTQLPSRVMKLEDFTELEDLVKLATYRAMGSVSNLYNTEHTMRFLSRLGDLWCSSGGLTEDVKLEHFNDGRPHQYNISVHFSRAVRLATLGQNSSLSSVTASMQAYACTMSSLCFMLVIPFEMFEAMSKLGPSWFDIIIHACRHRLLHMRQLSENFEFAPLVNYMGNLFDPQNDTIHTLWLRFIHRMRSTGVRYWKENRIIKCPPELVKLHKVNLRDYPGKYFEFISTEGTLVNWFVMTQNVIPIDPSITSSIIEDSDRYGEQDMEVGILQAFPRESYDHLCTITGAFTSFSNGKEDKRTGKSPIIQLCARDILPYDITPWVHPINQPLLKFISTKWGKQMMHTHLVTEESNGKHKLWLHTVSTRFFEVPGFYLGGTGKHASMRKTESIAIAYLVNSLVWMGIIPKEMYQLLRTYGEEWIEIIVYACRERFVAFDRLRKCPQFKPLELLPDARLYRNTTRFPPQLPLAYEFFGRMRITALQYWHKNADVMVPKTMKIPETRLSTQYFLFSSTTKKADWDTFLRLTPADDKYSLADLEEAFDAVMTLAPYENHKPFEDTVTQVKPDKDAITVEQACTELQKKVMGPPEIANLIAIMEALAESIGTKLIVKEEKGGGRYIASVRFGGGLSWLLKATNKSDSPQLSLQRSLSAVYRILLITAVVPPMFDELNMMARKPEIPMIVMSAEPMMRRLAYVAQNFVLTELPQPELKVIGLVRQKNENVWRTKAIPFPGRQFRNVQKNVKLKHLNLVKCSDDDESVLKWLIDQKMRERALSNASKEHRKRSRFTDTATSISPANSVEELDLIIDEDVNMEKFASEKWDILYEEDLTLVDDAQQLPKVTLKLPWEKDNVEGDEGNGYMDVEYEDEYLEE